MLTRHLSCLALVALCVTGQAVAQNVPEPPTVEQFAAPALYRSMVLSPDGKHIAFTYDDGNNEVKLGVTTVDVSKVTAVFEFGDNFHVGNQMWANNERLIMQVWKNTGYLDGRRQFGQRFAANLDGSKREEFAANIGSFVTVVDRLSDDPRHMLVTTQNFRDDGEIKLQKIDVYNGKFDMIKAIPPSSAETQMMDVALDNNDEIRIAVEIDRGKEDYETYDDRRFIHYRTSSGEWKDFELRPQRKEAWYFELGFSPDNQTYYFVSNFDMPENDTMAAFGMDMDSGEITLKFRHPDVDVQGGIYGPKGEVLGVSYEPGYPQQHYFYETNEWVQLQKAFAAAFPGQLAEIVSYAENGESAIVQVRSDRNPGMFYLYKEGKLKFLAAARPDLNTEQLGTTDAFTVRARDGVKLYGYLTLPPGREAKGLPMVVYVHGGPHGPFDSWGYDADVQLMAANGYAVLQVNFRGSGNYGQDFQESGHGQWGRAMQNDVTDATWWAINEGIADRERICIAGGSYGGYATLQGVVREPDLYQCAIGIAGVYSLPMFRKRGDYRQNPEAAKAFLDKFVGRDEEVLVANSPAYNVDAIQADLFIIHGKEDVRVPYAQAKFLRKQLDEAEMDYEWMVRKEGHGFTQIENRVDQYQQMLAFLNKHIGAP